MPTTSKLINTGSMGCVFSPNIPCKNKKEKRTRKKASKLIIRDDFLDKEFEINRLVSKIPGHERWTTVWFKRCISPEYRKLLKISEINKCLETKKDKLKNLNPKTSFKMLQGEFSGQSVPAHMTQLFTYYVFQNKKLFIHAFITLFKLLEPLFMGIVQLYENNICHHDITVGNILLKEGKFILIDYGLSFQMNQTKDVLKRMKKEFMNDRIYEAYPFEYIYYPINDTYTIEEQENIALKYYRKDYENIHKVIHVNLFHRNIDELRFEMLEDKLMKINKSKLSELIQSLDTYSLGMLPLILILDCAGNLIINHSLLIHLLKLPELKVYMDLFRNMTTFHCKDRITPTEAQKIYLNLLSQLR